MSTSSEARDTLIVVPCYNECRRLDVSAVERFVSTHPAVRFLFVDDGSTDSTGEVLADLATRHPDVIACRRLDVNSGKAEAVRQGMLAGLAGSATLIAYWDADLSTPLGSIDDFVAQFDKDPQLLGVLGSRIQRLGARVERSPLRHYAGRIFASLASIVLRLPVYDTQCGAKMFRGGREVAQAFAEPFLSKWIFDVELLARLQRSAAPASLSQRLFELPLQEWQDVAGSKLSTARGAAAFLELWQIYRKYR